MKILYLSCHSVLEYQELRILTEMDSVIDSKLDLEVFSMGAYSNPTQAGDYKRGVIPKGKFYPQLFDIAMQCDKDNIHPELIKWCDIILSMHNSTQPNPRHQQPWIVQNWAKFTDLHKRVIWRSIGQSTSATERELKPYKDKGLRVVRYSPREEKIPNYMGADAVIRFGEDPEEWKGYIGDKVQVMTIAQSFKKRGEHLGFSVFDRITSGFPRKVYGMENEDLGKDFGGTPSLHELQEELRHSRVYFYYGTQPASYTMSLVEAMMTGIPVVAVGNKLRDTIYHMDTYELPDIIVNGVNGFISDNPDELRNYIQLLLTNADRAKLVGDNGRKTAIQLFDRTTKMREWAELFKRT